MFYLEEEFWGKFFRNFTESSSIFDKKNNKFEETRSFRSFRSIDINNKFGKTRTRGTRHTRFLIIK